MKMRRRAVEQRYRMQIEALYSKPAGVDKPQSSTTRSG